MEELTKRIEKIRDLIKAIRQSKPIISTLPQIPSIKQPPPPPMTPASTMVPKISTGQGPNSKKDPKKMAEQIKNGSMSTKTQKVMLKATQWSTEEIEKADKDASLKLYHIHQGPHRITSEPLNLEQIKNRHGGVQKLENSGFRLIPHEPKVKKADADTWGLEPTDPSSI